MFDAQVPRSNSRCSTFAPLTSHFAPRTSRFQQEFLQSGQAQDIAYGGAGRGETEFQVSLEREFPGANHQPEPGAVDEAQPREIHQVFVQPG